MTKKKKVTIRTKSGTITQWVGPDHPAYHGAKFTFLACNNVEGKGIVTEVKGK